MIPRISCLVLVIFAIPAFAKFEIQNVQPSHGLFGPKRESDDVSPSEEYFVRYTVSGLKPDNQGQADLEMTVQLVTSEGKAVLDRKGPLQRPLSFGGDSLLTFSSVNFPDKAPAGVYTLKVTVRDKIANETASFERKLTCKPGTFRIINPRFFRDAEGKIISGTTAVAGESLHFQLKAVGLDKSQKKIATTLTVTTLTPDGKETGAKPFVVKGELTDPAEVARRNLANFNGVLSLHRPGDYILRIVVEDIPGKQTAKFECPMKILAP
jgi:hypothetical protein